MIDRWIAGFKKQGLWLSGEKSGKTDHITSDSRDVLQKTSTRFVFFARKGVTQDGHDYLTKLQAASNVDAFVVESIPEGFKTSAPVIVVRDATAAMALAAEDFYGDPTADTFCVAVTGTNGKTTSTFLIQSLLKQAGKRPARTGTIETDFEDVKIPSNLTTPDFTEMQKLFSELKKKGADAFVFEASSHALDQRRLLGIELDAGIFTNLTPEHLDYHQTMENYFQAKQKLFTELLMKSSKRNKWAILPIDGSFGSRLIQSLDYLKDLSVATWGFSPEAAVRKSDRHMLIEKWSTDLSGHSIQVSGFGLKQHIFRSSLVGKYNIENVAGMLTLGLAMGLKPELLQKTLDSLPPVSGRLEKVSVTSSRAKGASIFVDYAHTPDALENVLMTLRPLTKGKLKVVFGCGGDRDKTKRPKMGAIAELYADEIFVTSDNPRTEDPDAIIRDILQGLQRLKPLYVNADRKTAIFESLKSLQPEDVVVIAGKGHENYQILGTEKIHFDDREVVLSAFH